MYMILVLLTPVIVRLRVRVNSVTGNGKGWVHRFAAVVGRVRAASLGLYHSSCMLRLVLVPVSRLRVVRSRVCVAGASVGAGARSHPTTARVGVFASYRRRRPRRDRESRDGQNPRAAARPLARRPAPRPGGQGARAGGDQCTARRARAARRSRVSSLYSEITLTDR